MCQILRIPGRDDIETMGELRRLWPTLVAHASYSLSGVATAPDERCLCPVDILASAAANGASVQENYDGLYLLDPAPPRPRVGLEIRVGGRRIRARLLFVPRDLWLGLYWDRLPTGTRRWSDARGIAVYVGIVPTLPLRITWEWGNPNQDERRRDVID